MMLMKIRARKPLELGSGNLGFHPHGVGGVDARNPSSPAMSIQVGDHRLFMTMQEFDEMASSMDKLRKDS